MPKLPPPPRSPCISSLCGPESEAITTSPLASTTWASSTLSHAKPCWRPKYPKPPAKVSPDTPVSPFVPVTKPKPVPSSALSTSWMRHPPPTVALLASVSTSTLLSPDMSTTRASSTIDMAVCPPQYTANLSSLRHDVAALTTFCTSSTLATFAITAGYPASFNQKHLSRAAWYSLSFVLASTSLPSSSAPRDSAAPFTPSSACIAAPNLFASSCPGVTLWLVGPIV
mmetsp:Transcript_6926/g.9192  ORF Transcript_6926/g.9192 Transcript_6926/m.9192 type:complete len:227 (+) Transcript_6926:993-1673(+)